MDDREIARDAVDRQARSRDYRMLDIPAYPAWSERKLKEGVSDALIAHLDATSMWLLPEEAPKVTEADLDDLLADLVAEFGG